MLWLGAAAAAGVIYLGQGLFIPILVGLGGAYLINPLVRRLEERGVSRANAVSLVLVSLLATIGLGIWGWLPTIQAEGSRLIAEAPGYAAQIEASLDAASDEARTTWPLLARALPGHVEPGWLTRGVRASVSGGIVSSGLATVASIAILSPVFAFFVLRDGPRTVDWLIGSVHPVHIETSVAAWAQIDLIIGRYLRGLTLESAAVGLLSGLGLWILGVPFPLMLGLLAAVVNPVPYVGVLFCLTVAFLVALTAGMGVGSLAAVFTLFVVIRLIDDVVIVPLTIGRSVHLHPLFVIVSIVIGEHALGVLGMVLAVPVVTVIKEVVRLLVEHQFTLSRVRSPWVALEDDGHLPL
jgi:predicted PurR-regulated permease PerM